MAVSGISEVNLTIEEIISVITTRTLIQESVAMSMPGVWDRSGEVGPGMDTLDMIELAELAVQTVDETGAAMTPQTITPAVAKLILDQHKSIPFSLTKRASLQSKIALVQKTVENGARSLAADVDDYVFGEAVANAGSVQTVAGADGLEDVLGAAKPMRSLVASPEWMNNKLLATNTVQRANEYGSDQPLRAGFVGSLFGIQLFESTSSAIPSDGFLALGMEAVAFARQRSMEFERELRVLNQREDYALTHLYGAESTAASNPRIYVFDPA